MLALQAANHGVDSLQPFLIIISVLVAVFWKVAVKIALFLLLVATLVTLTLGAGALLPILAHMIK